MKRLMAAICLMILCYAGTAMADYTAYVAQDVTLESVGGSYTGTGMYAGYSTSYGIEDAALLFNQPSIPAGQAITSVTLNFDIYSTPSSTPTLNVSSNPNVGWTRYTASYSTFGVANNSLISSIANPGEQWYSVNVTSYVLSQLASGANSFTFVLGTGQLSSSAYYGIESSLYQNGRYESYLDYQTAVVPIPAALWLFGPGLAGLMGLKRRYLG